MRHYGPVPDYRLGSSGGWGRTSIRRDVNTTSSPSRLTYRQRTRAAAIATVGYPVVAAIGMTLRWTVEGQGHDKAILQSGRQPIFACWHGRILLGTYFYRGRGIAVMTSQNFDGEWIARIIERFGFHAPRGSTSRGGRRALAQMRRMAFNGLPTGFTVDGPRGPRHKVQPGAVWLASLTGNPILPFHAETDRHWTTSSWDATQVPKPFARAAMVVGKPIDVDRNVPATTLEEKRLELEQSLHQLEERASQLLNKSSVKVA